MPDFHPDRAKQVARSVLIASGGADGRGHYGGPAGVEERKIARVTRHKNLAVLRTYIRPETAFDDSEPVL